MNRMWATGSLPDSPGAPPVTCTHRAIFRGSYPRTLTGPPATLRMALFPRESIQMMAGIRGSPSAPTATVPDHWAVQPTPMKASAGTPAAPTARPGGGGDGRPPLGRVLFGSAPLQQTQGHRLGGVGHDPTAGRHHGHLGPTGAQVDGQHVLFGRSAGSSRAHHGTPARDHALTTQAPACTDGVASLELEDGARPGVPRGRRSTPTGPAPHGRPVRPSGRGRPVPPDGGGSSPTPPGRWPCAGPGRGGSPRGPAPGGAGRRRGSGRGRPPRRRPGTPRSRAGPGPGARPRHPPARPGRPAARPPPAAPRPAPRRRPRRRPCRMAARSCLDPLTPVGGPSSL